MLHTADACFAQEEDDDAPQEAEERSSPVSDRMTHAELAEHFGLSRRRIQFIEERALRKLKIAVIKEAQAAGVTPQEWLRGE